MADIREQLKEIAFDSGVEPHYCGKKECEASRQAELYFDRLEQLIKERQLYELNTVLEKSRGRNDIAQIQHLIINRIAELEGKE